LARFLPDTTAWVSYVIPELKMALKEYLIVLKNRRKRYLLFVLSYDLGHSCHCDGE